MKKKYIIIIILIVIFLAVIIIGNLNKTKNKSNNNYKVLTSFYPLYIMTLNITNGAQNVEVGNMADKITGCIHDYTLSTADLKKFEDTNIFIQNGAGLESFSQKVIDAYPNVKIVNCADSISNFIEDEDGDKNGHVWLGLDNYESEVKEIASKLSENNSSNASIYEENARAYIQKIDEIKTKFNGISNLNGKNAICLNESLEYLLNDLKINTTMIETDHEQNSLSAETVKNIISDMKKSNSKMIFIDKNDDSKVADTIAKETGATVYRLDSEMTGEKDLNAYINAMNYNYEILSKIQ